MSQVKLYNGNCLEVLKKAPDNSIDSIVTDPPYGLSFMGKKWDYDVPSVEIWKECLRVLKPGGHLLAFGGTRTYHRLVVAIEDAGFEIRDQIQWIYSQGFPKSQNIQKEGLKKGQCCGCETESEYAVQAVSNSDLSSALPANQAGLVLQSGLQESSVSAQRQAHGAGIDERSEQPSLEGRNNLQTQQRELRGPEVRSVSTGVSGNGAEGRVRDGASFNHSQTLGQTIDTNRGSASPGPQYPQQSAKQPGTVAGQSKPQNRRIGEACGECGKPVIPGGLGTALKPANEPICLARKPLSESTIAKNVLKHGTGGLNIDGTRIGISEDDPNHRKPSVGYADGSVFGLGGRQSENLNAAGRFPSNVILDEDAAKVLDEQSGILKSGSGQKNTRKSRGNTYGTPGESNNKQFEGDSGGASRFFYVAKASKSDRGEGNTHPTVKPIKLMEYLVKLVTPEGGKVLDPFMGSGTTGVAALRNGFQFRGIEMSTEYYEIATKRIQGETNGL